MLDAFAARGDLARFSLLCNESAFKGENTSFKVLRVMRLALHFFALCFGDKNIDSIERTDRSGKSSADSP
jgi:hypothetical protein